MMHMRMCCMYAAAANQHEMAFKFTQEDVHDVPFNQLTSPFHAGSLV